MKYLTDFKEVTLKNKTRNESSFNLYQWMGRIERTINLTQVCGGQLMRWASVK